jgi:hypothetical protein
MNVVEMNFRLLKENQTKIDLGRADVASNPQCHSSTKHLNLLRCANNQLYARCFNLPIAAIKISEMPCPNAAMPKRPFRGAFAAVDISIANEDSFSDYDHSDGESCWSSGSDNLSCEEGSTCDWESRNEAELAHQDLGLQPTDSESEWEEEDEE